MKRHWQILLSLSVILTGIVSYVAYRTRELSTPKRRWRRFHQPDAMPLDSISCHHLQGIYAIEEGQDFFGQSAVLKWSYTVEKATTLYHLSFFCQKSGLYIVCEGKKQGAVILLNGYWRKAAANGVGLVWLMMKGDPAQRQYNPINPVIFIEGFFGMKDKKPSKKISLRWKEPLSPKKPFDIIAHRGGCRNVDFLPVSENSIEMIKMAARFGATGIEIDVRMTKDSVPVIFHDSFFSVHTIKDKIYGGLLHNYTYNEIQNFELRKGGHIPTLDEILATVLYQTPLETVWLDIKKECNIQLIWAIQQNYLQKAAALGRNLNIYIGIPDNYILKCFTEMEVHRQIPSLTELDPKVAMQINAQVWAPQYTGGFQKADVAKVHAAGIKAYVWSLDSRKMIEWYMLEGGFDGLVTNAAPVVVHWLYTKSKWQVASSHSV